MTEVSTGTRLFDMILNCDIPCTLKVGQSRVKVWYRDQPLQCDICHGNHKISECDLRGKCRRCRQEGHFSRNCPVPWGRTDNVVPWVSPVSDPSPAEAAGCADVSTEAVPSGQPPVPLQLLNLTPWMMPQSVLLVFCVTLSLVLGRLIMKAPSVIL